MVSVTFGRLSNEATPHRVGPETPALEVPRDLDSYFFPLLAFEQQEGAPPFLFVYCEFVESDEAGLSRGLGFARAPDGTCSLEQAWADEVRRFRDEVGLEPLSQSPSWDAPFVAFETVTVEESEFGPRSAVRAHDKSVGRRKFPIVEVAPSWLQQPSHPVDSSGSPMDFVGQVSGAFLTPNAAAIEFYLFHSATDGRVVQVAQSS